jgi:hypothetical protein
MGVLKVTKSGAAVQFITDEGVVYQQGRLYLDNILKGNPGAVIQLTRMPYTVDPKEFGVSKVFEPDFVDMPDEAKKLMEVNAMDKRVIKMRDEVKSYEDKKVW